MAQYHAPLADISFVINDVLDAENLVGTLPPFDNIDSATIANIVEEAARVIAANLTDSRESADQTGVQLVDGKVIVPDSYHAAYDALREGGWIGLALHPEHGGQGLPYFLSQVMMELLSSANVSFSLFTSLSTGSYEALNAHASDTLKAIYLPKLASGEWTGTMCLTESGAGSDVGELRTKATPQADGCYHISGNKIFISAGDHQLGENIVHLVLARTPDSPPGTRGISMFLVPKYLPNADTTPGKRNAVECIALENKMGLHSSPTCQLQFDNATGFLVGELNQGIQNMFVMMNAARLFVGIQGLGIAELSKQNAVHYAKERRQGRTAEERRAPEPSTIDQHPDVQRMLLTMKALTEGGRVIAYEAVMHIDIARHHPDPAVAEAAQDYVDLMTPVCKSFLTDTGFDIASLGVQVYGGHGYIRDNGMEQQIRDAKVTCIYEGTNGIQAMDLTGRKLMIKNQSLPEQFFSKVTAFLTANSKNPDLEFITTPLAEGLVTLQSVTDWVTENNRANPNAVGIASHNYLRLFSLVALGHAWARMAEQALQQDNTAFAQDKLNTAKFFVAFLLPETKLLAQQVVNSSKFSCEEIL